MNVKAQNFGMESNISSTIYGNHRMAAALHAQEAWLV
jgi:hypothetical protein